CFEAENLRGFVHAAGAAAAIKPVPHNERVGINMERFGKVPPDLACCRVEAIHAVVAGAEEDEAARNTGARFCMAGRFEMPDFLSRFGVETEESAATVLV